MGGRVAAVVAVAAVVLVFAGLVRGAAATAPGPARAAVQRLLSPGPLNRHHADASCLTCHVPFRGAQNQGCLAGDCHSRTDLERSGEHPAVAELHRQTAGSRCTTCHTEHRGGRLTVAFHSKGETASLQEDCASCHAADGARAHPDIRDRRCAACHLSTKDWKQVQFDHRLVEGEACTACHRLPGGRLHQVSRDVSCTVCHSTTRWDDVRLRQHPRIPEFGEHMRIPCLECHPVTLRRAVPCSECHGRGGRFEGD